jgi:hypothetical protein
MQNNENIKPFISCTTHALDIGALTPFLRGLKKERN